MSPLAKCVLWGGRGELDREGVHRELQLTSWMLETMIDREDVSGIGMGVIGP